MLRFNFEIVKNLKTFSKRKFIHFTIKDTKNDLKLKISIPNTISLWKTFEKLLNSTPLELVSQIVFDFLE